MNKFDPLLKYKKTNTRNVVSQKRCYHNFSELITGIVYYIYGYLEEFM